MFGFGQMQMPFWKASIALKKGEVSDIVDTASGLHLILRRNDDPPEVSSAKSFPCPLTDLPDSL